MTTVGYVSDSVQRDSTVFVHGSAQLYGRIFLGRHTSVWLNAAMRSEIHEIRIGDYSNVQDFAMVHVGYRTPVIVGEYCSITHHATLHGCRIGDRCLIGINATVMDGAEIGANSIVAPHALVAENKIFPENSIIAGVPAKRIKTRDCGEENEKNALFYVQNARNYRAGTERMDVEWLSGLLGDS